MWTVRNRKPRQLENTVWWVLTQHLGLRGRELHHDLRVEELVRGVDSQGRKFFKYVEPPTKSRPLGLHHKHRIIDAKMYKSGGERCPYNILEQFLSKRPENAKERGFLYMRSLTKPVANGPWYSGVARDGVNFYAAHEEKLAPDTDGRRQKADRTFWQENRCAEAESRKFHTGSDKKCYWAFFRSWT